MNFSVSLVENQRRRLKSRLQNLEFHCEEPQARNLRHRGSNLKAKAEPPKDVIAAPSVEKVANDEPSGVRVKAGKKSLTDALSSLSIRTDSRIPYLCPSVTERSRRFDWKRNEMPSDALLARGFEREEIGRAFAAIAEHVDFRRISPRCNFSTCRAGNRLVELEISCSRIERSRAISEENGHGADKRKRYQLFPPRKLSPERLNRVCGGH